MTLSGGNQELMNMTHKVWLVMILLTHAVADPGKGADEISRYIVETHTIERFGDLSEPRRITFKLDSVAGRIWRMSDSGFIEIPVTSNMERNSVAIRKKMEEIYFPMVSFENTNARQALLYIKDKSREMDPEHIGVDIICSAEEPWPLISFNVKNVSLKDVIRYIADAAHYTYRIHGNQIIVERAGIIGEPIRSYIIQPRTLKWWILWFPELLDCQEAPERTRAVLRDILKRHGILLTDYDAVCLNPTGRRLEVQCKEDVHLSIERSLQEINAMFMPSPLYRLVTYTHGDYSGLLLLNCENGQTWRYEYAPHREEEITSGGDAFIMIDEVLLDNAARGDGATH